MNDITLSQVKNESVEEVLQMMQKLYKKNILKEKEILL